MVHLLEWLEGLKSMAALTLASWRTVGVQVSIGGESPVLHGMSEAI
ncbi:MAG: hypothetical protein JNL70_07020 [Saprospiraceae bacterium]|nr:hypothetical protein [Saprospiraceae bacterium]